jgi:hypothetical protein
VPLFPHPLSHLRMRLEVYPVEFLPGCTGHRMPVRRTRRQPRSTPIPSQPFKRPDRRRLRLPARPGMRTSKPLKFGKRGGVDKPVPRLLVPSAHLGSLLVHFFLSRLTRRSFFLSATPGTLPCPSRALTRAPGGCRPRSREGSGRGRTEGLDALFINAPSPDFTNKTGNLVVTDTWSLPTTKEQCKNGGWKPSGM